MHKIREALRLDAGGASQREIAVALGVARSTIGDVLARAAAAGLAWPLGDEIGDEALAGLLYRRPESGARLGARTKVEPDWAGVHLELKRAHVTLMLVWEEYRASHPDGYGYSRFCQLYRAFEARLAPTMRQPHAAGDKMFVDFAGATVPILIDRLTGAVRDASIFVACLGASSYTFARATFGQTTADWIGAQTAALEFFGGAPRAIVPDNPKAAISKACFYEPGVQRSYGEFAAHYDIAVLPARVRKPRDKAKVEAGVQLVQRWIVAKLRNRRFTSLSELNAAIAPLVMELNNRQMRRLNTSRAALFETVEKPVLRPLPAEPYVFAEWKIRRVGLDYHVDVDRHYYSVPYKYLRAEVDVRVAARTVEIFHKSTRIAAHRREATCGKHTTDPGHMPATHRTLAGWTLTKLVDDASRIGPATALMIEAIIAAKHHPEQAIRAGLGILRLARRFTPARLEAACARGIEAGARNYGSIASILENRLDQRPPMDRSMAGADGAAEPHSLGEHPNIRGRNYYN